MIEHIEAANRKLFLYLNASPMIPGYILQAAKLLANGLIFLVPLLLAGLWFWGNDERRNAVLKAIVVTIISLGIGFAIGIVWFHARPMALGLGNTYFYHTLDASFPSDHTTVFAAIGFSLLAAATRRWGYAMLAAAAAVGWSRVFLGVHFPLDILGAFVVSYLVARAVAPLWKKIGGSLTGYALRFYRFLLSPVIARGWIRN